MVRFSRATSFLATTMVVLCALTTDSTVAAAADTDGIANVPVNSVVPAQKFIRGSSATRRLKKDDKDKNAQTPVIDMATPEEVTAAAPTTTNNPNQWQGNNGVAVSWSVNTNKNTPATTGNATGTTAAIPESIDLNANTNTANLVVGDTPPTQEGVSTTPPPTQFQREAQSNGATVTITLEEVYDNSQGGSGQQQQQQQQQQQPQQQDQNNDVPPANINDFNNNNNVQATAPPTTAPANTNTNNNGNTNTGSGATVTITLDEVYNSQNGGGIANENQQPQQQQTQPPMIMDVPQATVPPATVQDETVPPAATTTTTDPPPPSSTGDGTAGNGNTGNTSPNAQCTDSESVDVLIIGAGMAGISAAATLQAQDPTLSYRILESTGRAGGRVRSHSFGGITIEDGANWIIEFNDNPMLTMAQASNFKAPLNDYTDYLTFDANGMPVDPTLVQAEEDRFRTAWDAAEAEAENQWTSDHESYPDRGVQAMLADQGWTIPAGPEGNLDYTIQWAALDWEYVFFVGSLLSSSFTTSFLINLFLVLVEYHDRYAAADTSVRFFGYCIDCLAYQVSDMRGYEFLPQSYLATNANPSNVRFNTRVTRINYDENVVSSDGKTYKTLVNTVDPSGACMDYYAQRVISTVPTGVISSKLITFNPPLQYSDEQYNPFYMAQYVKIFYQFPSKFWDDNEMIRVALNNGERGHCHHWANMDHPKFFPGSLVIRCEIMTEGFDELKDTVTQDLSQETLLALLDPVRTVYGSDNVPAPVDVYYPKLNKDPDTGFGAYANWKVGKSFTDFARFFGGVEDVVPYCEHNGCNSNGEWTMMLSGSATCFDWSEFVHGAFFSGEKAAYLTLQELGYDVKFKGSPCDIDWEWLA